VLLPLYFMSLRTFCDICQKEITNRTEEIRMWSWPMCSCCPGCWADETNWPKIHEILIKKIKPEVDKLGKGCVKHDAKYMFKTISHLPKRLRKSSGFLYKNCRLGLFQLLINFRKFVKSLIKLSHT